MRVAKLIVTDRDDRPFLWAEAKSRPPDPDIEEAILRQMWDEREGLPYGRGIRYGMMTDPASIRLYELDEDAPKLLASWSSEGILGHYSPDIVEKLHRPFGISSDFLATLTGSWISDLGSRWKSPEPPGQGRWEELGLFPLISQGLIWSEVPLGFGAVR